MGKAAAQTGAYLHHIAIESENPENLAKFYSSAMDMKSKQPVSYTHLTLPTKA